MNIVNIYKVGFINLLLHIQAIIVFMAARGAINLGVVLPRHRTWIGVVVVLLG